VRDFPGRDQRTFSAQRLHRPVRKPELLALSPVSGHFVGLRR